VNRRSSERARRVRQVGGSLATLLLALPLLAASPAGRGDPASRLPATDGATEYWDLVARFDSNHKFFARFLITNEGPGENTSVAYGHLIDPDGTAHFFSNGRRQGRWQLGPRGLHLEVGSSELDLTGPVYSLQVHKKKKGIDIDLRFTPRGPAVWDDSERGDAPKVDLLALAAPISGSAWFRGMPAPVELSGRVGVTHTWMERRESDLTLRRTDFFSLDGESPIYLRDQEAPDGSRSHWMAIARAGKIAFQSGDFELSSSGRSRAQQSAEYPVPGKLKIRGEKVEGYIEIGPGLLHHSPMDDIPQPFRFLLSFRLRPHRVWADSVFEVTYHSGSESVKIRGTGLATVTLLNPIPPTT